MKTMCVEWPESLVPDSEQFDVIQRQVAEQAPELLVTNEMPFGDWSWSSPEFSRAAAERNVQMHEAGLSALRSLGVPYVISSRPMWVGSRLANEAFVLEEGEYRVLHHKHYFPDHPGWFEAKWFHAGREGFEVAQVGGLKVGVALCTELMFNELSRAYGRAGADLIVTPRATGTTAQNWRIAAAMAALISGSYVVSSNRVGPMHGFDQTFGGAGMAYAPGGAALGETSAENPAFVFDLDPAVSAERRKHYPCDVDERPRIASKEALAG
jgi:N-carbamoylputrescine amidase